MFMNIFVEFLEHAECLSNPELDTEQRECVEGMQGGGDICK